MECEMSRWTECGRQVRAINRLPLAPVWDRVVLSDSRS